LLPSIACAVAATGVASLLPAFKGDIKLNPVKDEGNKYSFRMLVLGLGSIVCVPVFKIITHLPPYVGMMLALGVVAVFAEIYSNREFSLSQATGPDPDGNANESSHHESPVHKSLTKIEMPSILFFLGILLAVAALESLGLLFVFIMLTFIGFLTAGLIGRYIIKLGERIIARLPIIRSVYGALKQIFESVLKTSSKSFREVVLIEYPRKGIWAIGFITGDTKGEVQHSLKEEIVNVFLPTTPNPTSGFLLFVPRKDLKVLNMNVEEGIKMVISGGIVTPKFKQKYIKKDK